MPSFHLDNRAALKGISIFKTYQNIKQEFRKTIMINVSFGSCSKMIIHPDEVSHVSYVKVPISVDVLRELREGANHDQCNLWKLFENDHTPR